jgi:hypothetical protein
MAIKYDYDIDWEDIIKILVPGAEYNGKQKYRNQSGFTEDIQWTDTRPKPTWEEVATIWLQNSGPGSGVRHDRNSPGDTKTSCQSADHGNWLFLPPEGRTVERDTYPILFNVIQTQFNTQYTNVPNTHFGLPKPGGHVPMFAGPGQAIGKVGGSNDFVLKITIGGGNNPNATETTPYFVLGNLFLFAGELRYAKTNPL